MKFRYILILLSVLLLGACAEDKGNYVYHEINEVAIAEGLEQGKLYTKVSFVDNLTFDPVINSTLKDFNEADYEYEWKAIPRGKGRWFGAFNRTQNRYVVDIKTG